MSSTVVTTFEDELDKVCTMLQTEAEDLRQQRLQNYFLKDQLCHMNL